MKNEQKELELKDLSNVVGGTKPEIKEAVVFIQKYFPDVKVGSAKELNAFLRSIGVSKVVNNSTGANKYYDAEGNLMTHEEFMQLLRDHAG